MKWEFVGGRCKRLYPGWVNNAVPPQSPGSSGYSLCCSRLEKDVKKSPHTERDHFVHLKRTQHCKPATVQFKKELIFIPHKRFQKMETNTSQQLPKASVTAVPHPKKTTDPQLVCTCTQKARQNTRKPNPAAYKKDYKP